MANYKEITCIHYDSRLYKWGAGIIPNYEDHRTQSDPVGLLIHATGDGGTTTLRRYVQPSKTDPQYNQLIKVIGKNSNNNSWNRDIAKGAHYMLGKLADKSYGIAQMIPDNFAAWGAGSGKNGSYNYFPTQYIQCEIQDGNPASETYPIMVDWAAKMCKKYGWTSKNITSHYEAHAKGYGSNHGDPRDYFAKAGKTMDTFRKDVQAILDAGTKPEPTPTPVTPIITEIRVGDVVDFIGTKHFSNNSAADSKAKTCKPGKATVKKIYKNAKHPYLLKYVSGSGCTVNGYVNAEDIKVFTPYIPKVGDTVKFIGTKQYSNSNKTDLGYVTAKPGIAKINGFYKGAKHPYYIVGVKVPGESKASVNGYVNADTITEYVAPAKCEQPSVMTKISKNAKKNWKDIIVRAVKTFVEAFTAVILVDLSSIIIAFNEGNVTEVLMPVIISACASGISCLWNTFIAPLLDSSNVDVDVTDNELEITIDDEDIEIEDDEELGEYTDEIDESGFEYPEVNE